ncbi:TIR-like protein FxsC [Actinoplanes sp. NPDC026670]|uniref:TIR-like protein FxsC n=1 Tax=Actinoplanes sp. NPDC026670 TaxID=3154700 RepID=UPI0033FEED00
MSPAREVRVQPIVSWHPDEGSAAARIISVDLELADQAAGWPYEEEEFLVGCMIDGRPSCTVRALDSAGVVLHRFGGTYGPTWFRAELTDPSADLGTTSLWLTLTTSGGVPFYTAAIPLDGSGLRTAERPAPPPRPAPTPKPAPVADDPDAPVFLLSYARPARSRTVGPPREPSRDVIRLFDDLSELVGELTGAPAPGFMDRILDGGDRWESSLLRAAGTSQVLVSLLSGPYLRSPWCALEWDVFARRPVVSRTGEPHAQTAIVPVLWTPFSEPPPPTVAAVQMFTPTGLPDESGTARYLADGLFGLTQTGQTATYDAIVWKLALHIVRLHQDYRVEPLVPPGVEGLRTGF